MNDEKSKEKLTVLGDSGMTTVLRENFKFTLNSDEAMIYAMSSVDGELVPIQAFGDVDASQIFLEADKQIKQGVTTLNLEKIVSEFLGDSK